MTKSSLSTAFVRNVTAINKIAPSVIKWPHTAEMTKIGDKFKQIAGLDRVIGVIDGTYIRIDAPKENKQAYINRKGFYGVTLQAVCDSNLRFIDCFVGYPSSFPDITIFRNSVLYKYVSVNRHSFFPNNQYILGDAAYPCMSWCVPPYLNNDRLSWQQMLFNSVHAQTRQTINRSFALLFGRFPRLKQLQMKMQSFVPATVMAACVLHNFCLDFEDYSIDSYISNAMMFVKYNCDESSATNDGRSEENNALAHHFRNELCNNSSMKDLNIK